MQHGKHTKIPGTSRRPLRLEAASSGRVLNILSLPTHLYLYCYTFMHSHTHCLVRAS